MFPLHTINTPRLKGGI